MNSLINSFKKINHTNLKNYSKLLYNYKSQDYIKYVKEDRLKYNRTIVHKDNNFEIYVLTWLPFQKSGIHNHAENGCLMKVLEGNIIERKYNKDLHPISQDYLLKGDVSYIDDTMYYHSLTNNSMKTCVTLHVYSPPDHNTNFFL